MSDIDLQTILTFAGRHVDTETIQLLLEATPKIVRSKELRFTPLMAAAALGHVPQARCFVRAGANIRDCDPAGNSALRYALSAKSVEIVLLLLKAETSGEQQRHDVQSAFREVSNWGDPVAVELLLSGVSMDSGLDLSIDVMVDGSHQRHCTLCGRTLALDSEWVRIHFRDTHSLEISEGAATRILTEPKTKVRPTRGGYSGASAGLPGGGKRR